MTRTLSVVAALLTGVLLVAVVATTDRFPAADGPHMLSQALRLGAMLRAGQVLDVATAMFHLSAPHPPFAYVPMVFLATLGLPVRGVIAGSDALWLLLLWDASVRLCRMEGVDGKEAGSLAFIAGCAAGLTWWSADHHGFDLSTAAVVLQTLGWLHASDALSRRRESILFGAWLGAAFLTKYSAPLILFLPVILGTRYWRQPKNTGMALGAWALVAAIWLAFNGGAVLEYVGSALQPGMGPGNFPEQRTLFQRFAGDGQAMFGAVLKDALGYPLVVFLGLSALWARRRLPLLGLTSGIVFLGAMNSREGRYALPMVFLLAVAGAPRRAGGWQQAVMLLALAVSGLRGNFVAYQQSTGESVPSRRHLLHPLSTFQGLGGWPSPSVQFSPVSEHPGPWKVEEVLRTARPLLGDYPVLGILLDTLPEAPASSVYQLVAEEKDLNLDLLTVHALLTGRGLETNTYRAPLSSGNDAPPPKIGELRREPPAVRIFYVVTHPTQTAGAAWLAQTPHQVLQRWTLPDGHTGTLLSKSP